MQTAAIAPAAHRVAFHGLWLWHNFCGPVVIRQVRALDDVQVGCGADGI